MPVDVVKLRADTPGCAEVVHLNNAGAALVPGVVVDTVVEHLQLEAAVGGYEAAHLASAALEDVYDDLAALLGCDAADLALVESATRAWQAAAYSVRLRPGDRVLIGRAEYASGWIGLQQHASRNGAVVEVVPDDASGQLDVAALATMLDERVRLVAVCHSASHSGLLNPVAEVGRALAGSNALYLVDACQSVGQVRVDVGDLGCDLLCGTGRKFLRAPRGTGFLYASPRARAQTEPHVLDLRSADWTSPLHYQVRPDARRYEVWERPVALQLGLGASVRYLLHLGIEDVESRVVALAGLLRAELMTCPGVVVQDRGAHLGAIVTFTVASHSAQEVRDLLRSQRINTSAIDSGVAQLDLGSRGVDAVVRASVHAYNTEDELHRLVDALGDFAR